MTGYGFYRSIRFLVALTALAVGMLAFWVGLIFYIFGEFATENDFRQRYGDSWKIEYEQLHGPVSEAHTKMVVAVVGIVALAATAAWLVKSLMKSRNPAGQKSRRRKSSERGIEGWVRCKRKALIGISFGVPAILFSILLAVFRMGIFADHSNEMTLAIFIFLGGYCAVISGCYWWLKAKAWSEELLVIAFFPLVVFFIPFVRILILKVLGLLVAAMVMMPIILVVVVAVLPDKSGHGRKRAEWERRGERRH